MEKIVIEMTPREYKKFQAFKEADKITRSIKRGLSEARKAQEGKCRLKSAYQLANEL
ncbi:MAG: hypothetical protein LBL97_00305 [Prevotellaceae bacterium]|nr:hypothetical protein [Prevotellaceae bacterium]